MTEVRVWVPEKLKPVFTGPADVRGAYGGRGSAKTRSFAKMAAVRGYMYGMQGVSGIILCARQYMNSLEDSSLEEIKRAIEDEPWLADYYDVGEKYIKSKDGRISFAFCGLDRSVHSVKSKGRILILWVDEAEPVTEYAWKTVVPTLREEGEDWNAELWVTWNPERKGSPVDKRFRNTDDPLIKVVELNYRDNKRFPAKLERERLRDLEERPDQYPHVWDGDYVTVVEGAYYAKQLQAAKDGGRIKVIAPDPLMTIRGYIDIGGTGARADAFAMWICQFVGPEIRVIDYYEAVGQELADHLHWLRKSGYERASLILPHDGEQHEKLSRVTYESAIRAAGFDVRVSPSLGAGAASIRVEAVRRVFPNVHFNEEKTQAGREALGWYHPKIDQKRGIDLGPDHDWSSHAADAFGLMAIDYEQRPVASTQAPIKYKRLYR